MILVRERKNRYCTARHRMSVTFAEAQMWFRKPSFQYTITCMILVREKKKQCCAAGVRMSLTLLIHSVRSQRRTSNPQSNSLIIFLSWSSIFSTFTGKDGNIHVKVTVPALGVHIATTKQDTPTGQHNFLPDIAITSLTDTQRHQVSLPNCTQD